jgi:hypothetical protein
MLTSSAATSTVQPASAVATAGLGTVGQQTRLNGVRVAATPSPQGFFITRGTGTSLCCRRRPSPWPAAIGDTVNIEGVVLRAAGW